MLLLWTHVSGDRGAKMVKPHFLFVMLAIACTLATLLCIGAAATRTYHIDREWVKIWINQDGSIDLFYNITITLDSGEDINYVLVGQPNGYFAIGNATD